MRAGKDSRPALHTSRRASRACGQGPMLRPSMGCCIGRREEVVPSLEDRDHPTEQNRRSHARLSGAADEAFKLQAGK